MQQCSPPAIGRHRRQCCSTLLHCLFDWHRGHSPAAVHRQRQHTLVQKHSPLAVGSQTETAFSISRQQTETANLSAAALSTATDIDVTLHHTDRHSTECRVQQHSPPAVRKHSSTFHSCDRQTDTAHSTAAALSTATCTHIGVTLHRPPTERHRTLECSSNLHQPSAVRQKQQSPSAVSRQTQHTRLRQHSSLPPALTLASISTGHRQRGTAHSSAAAICTGRRQSDRNSNLHQPSADRDSTLECSSTPHCHPH